MNSDAFNHTKVDLETLHICDWLDNSAMESFQKCNRYGWYTSFHHLDIGTANMAAGTVFHDGMAEFSGSRNSGRADICLARSYQANSGVLKNSANRFSFQNIFAVFQKYKERYKDEPLASIVEEFPFSVWIESWEEPNKGVGFINNGFWLVGKCDGIIEKTGKLWIRERKTCESLTQNYLDGLNLSSQSRTYVLSLRRILESNGINPKMLMGVMYDIIAFTTTKAEFLRHPVVINDRDIAEHLEAVQDICALRRKTFARAPKRLPPKRTMQCNNYGTCPFINLCKVYKNHRDPENPPTTLNDYRRNVWNPLKA